jgi:CspA family cold shock protein
MALGIIKSFDVRRGAGLIAPDDGSADVFVHASAVERAGLSGVRTGDRVRYDVQIDRRLGRSYAVNLELA